MKLPVKILLGLVLAAALGAVTLWVASTLAERAVARDAIRRSQEWTQYAVHRLDRIEDLAAGETPTTEEWEMIDDLASFGGVFRFKVFSPDGVLRFESDDPTATGSSLGAHNPLAAGVIADGEPFSTVEDGTAKANRPDLYSETYLPVVRDGKIIAVLETYFDQTAATATVRREYAIFGSILIGLVVLALLGPSTGLVALFRRLRKQNVTLDEARLRALAADKAKSEFIATISHELRTPMNGIIGVAQLLKETDLSEENAELLDVLGSCSEAQMALIEDLLTFGAVEADALHLSEEAVTLAPFMKRAVSFARIAADKKGISFDVTVPDDDLRVMTDENRLRQVLVNLVGNAIKFTDEGGVELRAVYAPGNGSDAGELRVDVVDTGSGIPADQHKRIFERFTQVDSSSSRRAGGTGLGLAISDAIVREMGGDITLSSALGKGSTFSVRLPVRRARPEEGADGGVRVAA